VNFEDIMQRVQIESTLLKFVRYDPKKRQLDVELRSGELYRYFNVPSSCYLELLEAESKGTYYNRNIRKSFPYQNLSRPSAPVVLAGLKN
jgi:hypothetical protein